MREPRSPVVEQVYNLKDCRHHVIQVIVIGFFKNIEGLFGKYEKGGRRSGWVPIREGIGIGGSGAVTFEGGQSTVICPPNQRPERKCSRGGSEKGQGGP